MVESSHIFLPCPNIIIIFLTFLKNCTFHQIPTLRGPIVCTKKNYHLADRTRIAGVPPGVIHEVLALPEDVAADVAGVLHPASVDGHVLLQAVQPGELAAADGADEEAGGVLRDLGDVAQVGNRACRKKREEIVNWRQIRR